MDAMNKFKWTKKEGLAFNKIVLNLPVNVRCSKTDNAEWSVSPTLFSSYLNPQQVQSKEQTDIRKPSGPALVTVFGSLGIV